MITIPGRMGYDKVRRQSYLDVGSCEVTRVESGWIHRERFLDRSELIYAAEGELFLTVNGGDVRLGPGDVYLIRKYSVLSGSRSSEGGNRFCSISFDMSEGMYDDLFFRRIEPSGSAPLLQSLLEKIALRGTGENDGSGLADAALLLILELLHEAEGSEPALLSGIVRYINENIMLPLSAEDIAERFHYSCDYVSRVFKERYGMTVKQYIVQRKLSSAKNLLTTSDLSVARTGLALGFPSTELFEKFFRYHTGTTPRRYRQLYS